MSLPVREFHVRGYRSLADVAFPMSDLDVFVGANSAGKTNLYRALELIQAAATNKVARELAGEGGLASALWAGPRRAAAPARLRLAVGLGDPSRGRPGVNAWRYEVEIGFPQPTAAAFEAEPQIKEESLAWLGGARRVRLLERSGRSVMVRGEDGRPTEIDLDLLDSETLLGRLEDPARYPEMDAVRRTLIQWRFYHGFRTDAGSPLRRPCPAAATPSLASDGADLAAVFATLAHIRQDTTDLDAAVERAFPGARLIIPKPDRTASFGVCFPEFPKRIFEAAELSDGTLRFLALAGAMLAYRLPPFIALNEPEASLHPGLMSAVAELVVGAAQRTQIWLVTHSRELADAVAAAGTGMVRTVFKENGATRIEGLRDWGAFADDD